MTTSTAHNFLHNTVFDHHFARHLPGEAGPPLESRQVHDACWSEVPPTPVAAPSLLAWSDDLAQTLGLVLPEDTASTAELLVNVIAS